VIDVYPELASVAIKIQIWEHDTDLQMVRVDVEDMLQVALRQEATLSASIGRSDDCTSAGTLGGLIQV
jgi:hypothetical protein